MVEPGHVDQTLSKDRTNSAAWIPRGVDPLVSAVEQRIARITTTRVEMGEDVQVLLSRQCAQRASSRRRPIQGLVPVVASPRSDCSRRIAEALRHAGTR